MFWTHLVLWVGAIVFASLAYTAVSDCCSEATFTLGLGTAPYTLRLVQRIALAVALGAYPAGIAASQHVLPRRGASSLGAFALGVGAPLLLGALLLVGYGVPAAGRSDDGSRTPFLRGQPEFYYLHELRDSMQVLSVRADSEAAALNPRLWQSNPDVARLGNSRRSRAARLALDFAGYERFTLAFALLPLVLALIGICTRAWSERTSPYTRRLQDWAMALLLLGGMQVTLGFSAPFLTPRPFWEQWHFLARNGAGILFVPLLVLLALAWTTTLARRPDAEAAARPREPAAAAV